MRRISSWYQCKIDQKVKRINFDYRVYKEPIFFGRLIFVNLFKKKKSGKGSNNILIVNVCLVGEFATSLPALRDFIMRNPDKKIDLVVSPPLKPLAEKIIGVRHIFTASSVYGREEEKSIAGKQHFDAYEKIIVMRISGDAYRMIRSVSAHKIETGLRQFIAYALHLFKGLVIGQTPKRWSDVNFAMLGGTVRDIPFQEVLHLEQEDHLAKRFPVLSRLEKKIVIHTGASWIMNFWNNDNWIELLKKLNELDRFTFIFTGTKKDENDFKYISSRLDFPIYPLIDLDLAELMFLLRTSDYFIGIDSGPRNLAHVADLPSITILGPGPHMYTPPNTRDIVLDQSGGRGFYQRFFYKNKNSFIDKTRPEDVYKAFKENIYQQ